MGTFIWRSFIVIVIFICGLLVGNIFAPKQVLQEKGIVAIVQVKTFLDLDAQDNFETLAQSQNITEIYLAFLRQSYQRAKLGYEYQLQNIFKNPQDQKDFIKAQKDYLSIVKYIEKTYPLKQEDLSESAQETEQQLTSEQTQAEQILLEQTTQAQIKQDLTEEATTQQQI